MITNPIINQAIHYILEHINDEITIEEISNYFHFSKSYFSRLFKQETGEGIYQFIKRVKLEQGAIKLKATKAPITRIGADYGYSASNFSSAFKQHHQMSPAKFQQHILKHSLTHPMFPNITVNLGTFQECNAKITLEILPDYTVIYDRFIGDYKNLSMDWCTFQEKYSAYRENDSLLIERTFDDPSITANNKCLYDLCMTVSPSCTLENKYVISGGKFAVYHFKGHYQEIYSAYQNISCVWIKQSSHTIDDRYGFDIYRMIDDETCNMEIDICIPLQ